MTILTLECHFWKLILLMVSRNFSLDSSCTISVVGLTVLSTSSLEGFWNEVPFSLPWWEVFSRCFNLWLWSILRVVKFSLGFELQNRFLWFLSEGYWPSHILFGFETFGFRNIYFWCLNPRLTSTYWFVTNVNKGSILIFTFGTKMASFPTLKAFSCYSWRGWFLFVIGPFSCSFFELLLPIVFGCYSFTMECLRGFCASEFRSPFLFARASLAIKLTVRGGLAGIARGCVDI